MRTMVLAVAVVLTACAAQASHAPVVHNLALASEAGASDPPVCEVTTVTGTHVARTVCRTRSEADAEVDGARAWRDRAPGDPTIQDTSSHPTHDPFGRLNTRGAP